MDAIEIGASLRAARNSRSLSLDNLSVLSGVSKNAIWQIEKGFNSPTVTTLEKLSAALDIDCWRIMRHAHKSKVRRIKETSSNCEPAVQ